MQKLQKIGRLLTQKRFIFLAAVIAALLLSPAGYLNKNGCSQFGFPFIWLKFHHQGQSISFLALLKIFGYEIHLDILFIDAFIFYLCFRMILYLINKFKQYKNTNESRSQE